MMPTCSQREQGTKARIAIGVMKWTDVENCLGGCSVAASVGASGGGLAELLESNQDDQGLLKLLPSVLLMSVDLLYFVGTESEREPLIDFKEGQDESVGLE